MSLQHLAIASLMLVPLLYYLNQDQVNADIAVATPNCNNEFSRFIVGRGYNRTAQYKELVTYDNLLMHDLNQKIAPQFAFIDTGASATVFASLDGIQYMIKGYVVNNKTGSSHEIMMIVMKDNHDIVEFKSRVYNAPVNIPMPRRHVPGFVALSKRYPVDLI